MSDPKPLNRCESEIAEALSESQIGAVTMAESTFATTTARTWSAGLIRKRCGRRGGTKRGVRVIRLAWPSLEPGKLPLSSCVL
jgi:hypothetical protein